LGCNFIGYQSCKLKNHINSRGYTCCCDDFAQKNQSTQIPHNNINSSKTSLKKLILLFLEIMWSYRATSQLRHGQHKWHTNTQIENASKQCHTIVLGCEGKISNIQHHNCSTCLNFYKFISDQKGQYAKQANMWDTYVKMWRLLLTLFRGIVHGESNIGIIQMKFLLKGYLWNLVFLVNHHLNCRLL